tara:strand:- start:1371 stop:1499 length:129 start_codon:yes stop_codon:yes gene_type:complete
MKRFSLLALSAGFLFSLSTLSNSNDFGAGGVLNWVNVIVKYL